MQSSFTRETISIREFRSEYEDLVSYPDCQRDYVWKLNMKQRLIDSVLRGWPIAPVIVYKRHLALGGGFKYYIVDGQQRIETIRRFWSNKFRTASKFRDEPRLKPVCPNKSYEELDQQDQRLFDSYRLDFNVIDDSFANGAVESIFRRLQNQVKLTFSEKLFSYTGDAKTIADDSDIDHHRFWSDIYRGRIDRKQKFQAVLQLIMMETQGVYRNMTTPRLIDIAAQTKTLSDIPGLKRSISDRLNICARLYRNADVRAIYHMIPVYQSVLLLEQDYCLTTAPEGILAEWFNSVRQDRLNDQRYRGYDLFALLTKVHEQRKFWSDNMSIVEGLLSAYWRDTKRRFSVNDKLVAWNRQNGKCLRCGEPLSVSDVGHHVVWHADAGKTIAENCELVHDKCHHRLASLV